MNDSVPMSPTAQRGRLIVLCAIAALLVSDVLVIALAIARKGFSDSGGSMIRFFITVALFYAVYRGHAWARWLTVGLISIAFVGMAAIVLYMPHPILIGMTLVYGMTAGLLAFPPSVSVFLAHQRLALPIKPPEEPYDY